MLKFSHEACEDLCMRQDVRSMGIFQGTGIGLSLTKAHIGFTVHSSPRVLTWPERSNSCLCMAEALASTRNFQNANQMSTGACSPQHFRSERTIYLHLDVQSQSSWLKSKTMPEDWWQRQQDGVSQVWGDRFIPLADHASQSWLGMRWHRVTLMNPTLAPTDNAVRILISTPATLSY